MNGVFNNWKLSVNGYGKIEYAEIEMSPMTILVGENNSGKSYLMTLIYGFLTMPATVLFGNIDFTTNLAEEVRSIIVNSDDGTYQLSKNDIALMGRLLNEQLVVNKKKIMNYLFNSDVTIEAIRIDLSSNTSFSFKKESTIDRDGNPIYTISPVWTAGRCVLGYSYKNGNSNSNSLERVICSVMQYLLRKTINEFSQEGSGIYLPSARTGFMLIYKELVGNALYDRYSGEESYGFHGSLTRPNIDFINRLAQISIDKMREENRAIVAFIEKRIVTGRIVARKTPVMSVEYEPFGYNSTMPLYVTSAVVTEVAPLLLFLQFTKPCAIFYEEPETSLHPALQKELARVLIKLVNSGIPLFITTHSDIIIQQINNMIKTDDSNDKSDIISRLQYDIDDVISREEVRVYQVDSDENHQSLINAISCGRYGFEVKTFYDTFVSMSQEIDVIEGNE